MGPEYKKRWKDGIYRKKNRKDSDRRRKIDIRGHEDRDGKKKDNERGQDDRVGKDEYKDRGTGRWRWEKGRYGGGSGG
jgi:hypothetical protein